MKVENLSSEQNRAVRCLMSKYGAVGQGYTTQNQKFLKLHLDGDHVEAWKTQPSEECVADFNRVVGGDYSGLTESQRCDLRKAREKADDTRHWLEVIGEGENEV